MPSAVERERAPDLTHGDGMVAWCIEPYGFITRMDEATHLTEQMARWICDDVFALALKRRIGAAKMRVYNDFLNMVGYDTGARRVCTSWAMEHRREIEILQVSIAPRNRLASMGIHVAAMSLRVVGLAVQIDPGLPRTVRKLLAR